MTQLPNPPITQSPNYPITKFFALFYLVVDRFIERRTPYREEHLRLVRDLHALGEIVMAGCARRAGRWPAGVQESGHGRAFRRRRSVRAERPGCALVRAAVERRGRPGARRRACPRREGPRRANRPCRQPPLRLHVLPVPPGPPRSLLRTLVYRPTRDPLQFFSTLATDLRRRRVRGDGRRTHLRPERSRGRQGRAGHQPAGIPQGPWPRALEAAPRAGAAHLGRRSPSAPAPSHSAGIPPRSHRGVRGCDDGVRGPRPPAAGRTARRSMPRRR